MKTGQEGQIIFHIFSNLCYQFYALFIQEGGMLHDSISYSWNDFERQKLKKKKKKKQKKPSSRTNKSEYKVDKCDNKREEQNDNNIMISLQNDIEIPR